MRMAVFSGKFACLLSLLCISAVAFAASPGLPFTEDFSDNNLQDTTGSTADWNTAAEQLQIPRAAALFGTDWPTVIAFTFSEANTTEGFVCGDVNGDGYIDLIVINFDEVNQLYLNNGTDTPFSSVTPSNISSDALSTRSGALGDVDNDGDLDLVVGVTNGNNRLYLNDGTANPFNGVSGSDIDTDGQSTHGVTLADFDQDGDLDLLAQTFADAPSSLYLNDGVDAPWDTATARPVGPTTPNTQGHVVADLNEDGHLDVVFAVEGNDSFLVLNNGTTDPFNSVTPFDFPSHTAGARSVDAGDLDNDGDIDLVFGLDGSGAINELFLNNGTSIPFQSVTAVGITTDADITGQCKLADINCDGALDLVVANRGSAPTGKLNRLYLNNRTSDPFNGVSGIDLSSEVNLSNAVEIADFDRDGIPDIVVGNIGGAGGPTANYFYTNPGTRNPFEGVVADEISNDINATSDIISGDFDGDGRIDLVSANDAAVNRLYLNQGGADPFPNNTWSDISTETDRSDEGWTADVDNDGDLDLLMNNFAGSTGRLYLNNGTATPFFGISSTDIDVSPGVFREARFGDMDNDGDLDLVVVRESNDTWLYMNDGSNDPYDVTPQVVENDGGWRNSLDVADIDNDGDLDVIIGYWGDAPLRLYLSDGSATPFSSSSAIPLEAGNRHAHTIIIEDFNGDGARDLFFGDGSGNAAVMFYGDGTSDPFNGVTPVVLDSANNTANANVGDVDGDGDLDILGGSGGNEIRLFLNDGTSDPFSTDDFIALTPADEQTGVEFADLDNDGDLDVAYSLRSPSRTKRLLWNQAADNGGLHPFNSSTYRGNDFAAPAITSEEFAIGDLDGDGDLDMITGEGAGNTRLYLNSGAYSPFSASTVVDATTLSSRSVALGDLDADGDLDLVVGCASLSGTQDRFYLNNGTSDPFSAVTATMVSGDTLSTGTIVLADFDGDGDLDIAAGNLKNEIADSPNRLYLNNGTVDPFNGVLGSNIGGEKDETQVMAVGDMDGDGDLDIVTGNNGDGGSGEINRLYLNNGTLTPFNGVSGLNVSSDTLSTLALKLGDMNGDGHLDVVAGGFNGTTIRLYVNNGTSDPFNAVSGLDVSADTDDVLGLDLADIDLDGDLDIVAGVFSASQANRVYINDGSGSFASAVDLSSTMRYTAHIEVVDANGDGKQDVLSLTRGSGAIHSLVASRLYCVNTAYTTSLKVNDLETGIQDVQFNSNSLLLPHVSVDYWVSVDGGLLWKKTRPGRNVNFVSPGDDLRWRAELKSLSPIYSPSVSEITLSLNAPTINPSVPNIETAQAVNANYDLTSHENDSEDSGADLSWSISGVDTGLYTASIDNATNDVLSIMPVGAATGQDTATLTLTDSDGLTDTQDILVIIGSTGPTPPTTFIFPIAPVVTDSLVCAIVFDGTVGAGITPQYEYTWDNGIDPPVVNGPTGLLSDTLDAFYTEAGDVWQCTVRTYDGSQYSAPSVASTTPPILGLGASAMTLTAQPDVITLGQSIAITAQINPAVQGVNVFYDNSVTPVGGTDNKPSTQATNFFGEAIQIFTPDEAGPWSLVAEWLGNGDYAGDTATVGVTVNKAQPTLSVALAFESGVAGLPLVLETDTVATVSLNNANLEAAIPGIFDGLGIQLSVRESVPGQPVGTTTLVPVSGTIPASSNGDAVFLRSDFTAAGIDFSTAGTYEIQAKFEGNAGLNSAFSESFGQPDTPAIQVKSGAGYAIICVGRLSSGEGLASHNYTADFVYRTLIDREFDADDIYYLRQGTSAPGFDNISDITIDDSTPTEADFQNAIESWAVTKMSASPGPLYVIMIDHGLPGQFFIADTGDETRLIDPIELASSMSILDSNLLGTAAETENRIIVYGACNSGSFIPFVSGPNRIIVTASTAVEESHRGVIDPIINVRDGELFTRLLFRNLRKGRKLKESFERAARKVTEFTFSRSNLSLGAAVQTPLLDDNGDGVGSAFGTLSSIQTPGVDGALANSITLGISKNAGESIGWFSATPVITLADGEALTELDAFSQTPVPASTSAWIAVKPPSFAGAADVDAGDAENEQRSLDLTQRDWNETASNTSTGLFRWSDAVKGSSLNDLFSTPGAYQVYFYLRDGSTGVVGTHILTTVFRQQAAPTPPSAPSLLFPAEGSTVGTTWVYGWTESTDADGDVTYEVQFAAPNDTGFTTILAGRSGIVSTAAQIGPGDGIVDNTNYIWRVVAYDKFGASTVSTETRSISFDQTNEGQATLFGFVTEINGAPIDDAEVTLNGPLNADYMTQKTGVYVFDILLAGSYAITIAKNGYETIEETVNLDEGDSTTRNYILIQDGLRFWGDVSADGDAGTVDASYIIQWRTTDGGGGFLRNTFPSDPSYDPTQVPGTCTFTQRLTGSCMDFPPYADVDGDGELAIQDAIEILQVKVGQGSNQPYLPADATDAQPNNHIYDAAKSYGFVMDKGGARFVRTPSGAAMPSEIVDVPIMIDDATNIESMTIILEYNPDVLTALGAARGSVTSGWSIFAVDTTSLPGTVIIQGGDVLAASGSGSIANVTFEVKAGTQGLNSPLTLSTVSLKPDIESSVSSGTLTITDGSSEPNPYDQNGDGMVNSVDVQSIILAVLGGDTSADTNNDGQVNSVDIQETINMILGVK